MSPLFGGHKDPEPVLPQLSAGQLLAMPVGRVAALILPVWAAGDQVPQRWRSGEWVAGRIAARCTGQPEPHLYDPRQPVTDPLVRVIAEAIAALEQAGLLLRTYSRDEGTLLHLTRRGQRALADGTVHRCLPAPGE